MELLTYELFHGHVAFLTTVGALAIEYEWSIGVVALIFSGIPLSARGAAGSGHGRIWD